MTNASEGEIVRNSRIDTLYSKDFRDGVGKFFNIVTYDEGGSPEELQIELTPRIRITLVFIKEKQDIQEVRIKKFRYRKPGKWLQDKSEEITFPNLTFQKLVAFLRFLSELDLAAINERRIALTDDTFQELDAETRRKIKTLLAQKDGPSIVEELLASGLITSTDIVNIGYRKRELQTFKRLLDDPSYHDVFRRERGIRDGRLEILWQHFFKANAWIFGYGLDYRFLGILQKEAHLGSTDLAGRDGAIGDFLLGCKKFTVLVELKQPETKLFSEKKNRANSWSLSEAFIDAISQILEQKASWQVQAEVYPHKHFNEHGELITQRTFDPKAILIIGRSRQFTGTDNVMQIKAKTFELFRRDSRNIEVLTYDELYERAAFIVSSHRSAR